MSYGDRDRELTLLARALDMKTTTFRRVETTRTIVMTGEYIVRMLRAMGVQVPDNAKIEFTVPGGGDWSNTSIDVDAEHPVEITWKEIEE